MCLSIQAWLISMYVYPSRSIVNSVHEKSSQENPQARITTQILCSVQKSVCSVSLLDCSLCQSISFYDLWYCVSLIVEPWLSLCCSASPTFLLFLSPSFSLCPPFTFSMAFTSFSFPSPSSSSFHSPLPLSLPYSPMIFCLVEPAF